MAKGEKDRGNFVSRIGSTAKGLVKIALQSRLDTVKPVASKQDSIVIMGNGPSLRDTMRDFPDVLSSVPTMAVNFAALAPEFQQLKPRFYLMVDPVFFDKNPHENVIRLREAFAQINWKMTLFVPRSARRRCENLKSEFVDIQYFNPVGVEGFQWFEDWAYRSGRAMPRPRNVLIPAIMIAIRLGFGQIYIAGADHSWHQSLAVDNLNRVFSAPVHYYKDNAAESQRIATAYSDLAIHEIFYSYYIAFRAYYTLRRFARRSGVDIYIATPQSFIDAFERRSLCDLR